MGPNDVLDGVYYPKGWKWRFGGLNPQSKNSNCLLMIYQGAAPISDFAFYEITFVVLFTS